MLAKQGPFYSIALCLACVAGCHDLPNGAKFARDRMDAERLDAKPAFLYMADNAILHDMSLVDFHFIPHGIELSGTGVARLERMAWLLDAYGGTIRYETIETDEALIRDRLANVTEYLTLLECDMDKVSMEVCMSGGRGMPADEAIEIRQKGTAMESEAGGSPMAQMMGGMQGGNKGQATQ